MSVERKNATPSAGPTDAMTIDPVYGDLQYLPEMQKNLLKGNVVRGFIRYAIDTYGREATERMAQTLPDDARNLVMEPPLPSLWVPFGPHMEMVRGMALQLMEGDIPKFRAIAEYIARTDIASVYKVLLKMLSTPSFLINRIGSVHDMYARGVELRGSTPMPGRGHVALVSGVLPLFHCTYGVPGWLDAALNLYGVKTPRIEHETCRHRGDPQCTWSVRWT